MRKKILMLMMALTVSVATFAQFEKGTAYVSTGLSGASLNYSGSESWRFDVGAKVGYFLEKDWMALAQDEYNYRKYEPNAFSLGLAIRYYLSDNGIYMGGGLNYEHRTYCDEHMDDFLPTVHVGYAYFLSRTVTIEPEVYYNQSLKNHRDFSNFGFRLNIGVYLDDLF
jgi:hypothetical protein